MHWWIVARMQLRERRPPPIKSAVASASDAMITRRACGSIGPYTQITAPAVMASRAEMRRSRRRGSTSNPIWNFIPQQHAPRPW